MQHAITKHGESIRHIWAPLVDSCGRKHTYLRISVTDRCNLRCVYCMPVEGIVHADRKEILTYDELVRLTGIFARMGINKVRLTGGEPLVRKRIEHLVSQLAGIPGIETIGMTTNGVLLVEHAPKLKKAGLTHLNISLDSLRPERYARIALSDHCTSALAGIDAALAAGFTPVKVNMVVLGGINDDEILDFVELARHRPIHVRFIEYMPFKSNRRHDTGFVSTAAIRERIERQFALAPVTMIPNNSQVAREYRIPGFCGTIGLISPMSDHFCDFCNRLRLIADGAVKSCLFYPAEVRLREVLRSGGSDEDLAWMIRQALAAKPEAHPPMDKLSELESHSMIEIGG